MQNNSPALLALSRVSARYEDATTDELVLRNISLVVTKGSFVAIAGPSGAGKSTLLRVILGLLPAASGSVVRIYERPAMVFQSFANFPWLTVLENAAFGLKMRGVSRAEREKIAREKLKEVGLEGEEHKYPNELSGGMKQRVSIARALALSPDFLLMDEPFSSLDSITAEGLKQDVLKLWKQYGMTILMVSHSIPDAVELSDEVLVVSAHPAEIKKTLAINLPRPRDARERSFFRYVDELTEAIRTVS